MLWLPIILILSSRHHSAKVFGWSWSTINSADRAPRVSGHTTATINIEQNNNNGNGNNDVLLFGGLTGAAGAPTTNDLWHFDSAKYDWTQRMLRPNDNDNESMSPTTSTTTCPRVRMYAASAMIGNEYYIFGGWDPMEAGSGGEFLDDIWSFDSAAGTWSEHEKSKLPYPVSRHAAVSVNDDDMVVIHTYRGVLAFKDGILTEQKTVGDDDNAPHSLSMCAMTSIGDDKVVLFGGSDKNQQMSSELYILDTTTNWTWTKLQLANDKDGPPAMASASMAPLSNNQCIVFGGAALAPNGYENGYGLLPKDDTWICTFDDTTVEWEKLELACNNCPEARVAASLNRLEDGRFLLQGGYDPITKATFGNPWILSEE